MGEKLPKIEAVKVALALVEKGFMICLTKSKFVYHYFSFICLSNT